MNILNEHESKNLLEKWGIPVIREIEAQGPSEAKQAAAELGFPVALKICSPHIPHKSDRGGVKLNIENHSALAHAVMEMESSFKGVPHTLLVQKMAPGGIELILGAKLDPVFGPFVLVGMGGIFTEILKDTTLELAPVDMSTAKSMINKLKGAPLLKGFRGMEAMDIEAAARALVNLSRMAAKNPRIVEVDVNPLIVHANGAVAVDALIRIEKQSLKPQNAGKPGPETLSAFFKPRSIAVVGASRNPLKGGNIIIRNLQRADSKATIFPVNPTGQSILGLKSYKTIHDIPQHVDMAMIVIPKSQVDAALEQCAEKGIRNVILSTGGYSDIGEQGRIEQEQLMKKASARGIRIMGPNSIGTINPRFGIATSIVGLEPIRHGGISLFGQTGVFSSGWGRWIADMQPFGIAKVACIGNKGDVDETDLIEFAALDPETKVTGLYLEGVKDGGRFIKAAKKAVKQKPMVVLKTGRTASGAEAIASHTGSLAPADAVFDAVCRRTGMIRVPDPEAFFDALAAMETLPLPRGRRLGVLSITGLGCVLTSDAAEDNGIVLPPLKPKTIKAIREVAPKWAPLRNPVDIWSAIEQHGAKKTMSHIAQCLLQQNDIDAVMVIFVLMPESIFDIEEAFSDLVKRYPDKPMIVTYFGGTNQEIRHIIHGFSKLGVPSYPTPERALRAFKSLADYADFKKKSRN